MKLGVVTPVVTMNPRAHGAWEQHGTFDDVVVMIQTAERLGYHHCTCSEHVAVPVDAAVRRGGRYYDPLPTFGALGALTSSIRFAAHVLVLGYHHPLAIAKRYGTLDVVTGGRVILGVGVGTLKEEFELLGVPFDDRGERADDAMRALRASLSQPKPSYHGEYYAFDGMLVDPCAVQAHVPMWVGGRTFRSWRRAVELADGWAPFGLTPEVAAEMLRKLPPPTDRPFDVFLQCEDIDPVAEPQRAADELGRRADAGATGVNLRFVHHSRDHFCEQLAALVDVTASM